MLSVTHLQSSPFVVAVLAGFSADQGMRELVFGPEIGHAEGEGARRLGFRQQGAIRAEGLIRGTEAMAVEDTGLVKFLEAIEGRSLVGEEARIAGGGAWSLPDPLSFLFERMPFSMTCQLLMKLLLGQDVVLTFLLLSLANYARRRVDFSPGSADIVEIPAPVPKEEDDVGCPGNGCRSCRGRSALPAQMVDFEAGALKLARSVRSVYSQRTFRLLSPPVQSLLG